MQTTQENTETIKWNDFLDIAEVDDFDFKLIDEGVGFHHKESVEKKTVVRKAQPRRAVERSSAHAARREIQRTVTPALRNKLPEVPVIEKPRTLKAKSVRAKAMNHLPEVSMPTSEVAIPRAEKQRTKIEKKVRTLKKIKTASIETRMAAYIVDLMFLVALGFLFVFMGSFLTGTSIDNFAKIAYQPQYVPFYIALGLMTYIFYFSLMDCDQTLGKKMFNIKVVEKKEAKPCRFMASLLRTLLGLTILPAVFSFQDSLSDTNVIKCN